jgi:hypothetical protein
LSFSNTLAAGRSVLAKMEADKAAAAQKNGRAHSNGSSSSSSKSSETTPEKKTRRRKGLFAPIDFSVFFSEVLQFTLHELWALSFGQMVIQVDFGLLWIAGD